MIHHLKHSPLLLFFAIACGDSESPSSSAAPLDMGQADVSLQDMQASDQGKFPDDTGTSAQDMNTSSHEDASMDLSSSEEEMSGGIDASTPPDISSSEGGLRGLRGVICKDTPTEPVDLGQLGSPKGVSLGDVSVTFLEGPVWRQSEQALYFTDLNQGTSNKPLVDDSSGPPSIIYKLTASGDLEVFSAEGEVRANGMAIGEEDKFLYAATHDVRGISKISLQDASRQVVLSDYEGKAFNNTNDLVLSSQGTVYFTDPAYNGQLDGRDRELDFEGVFSVDAQGGVQLIDKTIQRPNGITLSPDESWLYVASRKSNDLYRYPIDESGVVGARETLIPGVSVDGVAVDCQGNLYLALPKKGVEIYTPEGQKVTRLSGTKAVTNLAIGGPNNATLYITEQKALKTLELPLAGMPY